MQQNEPNARPRLAYSASTSFSTSFVVAKSFAVAALRRNGTTAPFACATSAISASSVETITSSKSSEPLAAAIAYAIMGLPMNAFTFFRGIRFDPPRAVMIASMGFLCVMPSSPLRRRRSDSHRP